MPVQTTNKDYVFFPDGAKVSIKASGDSQYFDVGAILGDTTATLNWDESQVETANAGKLAKHIKNMTIEGGFTLINLDPEGVEKLGGGVFTYVSVDGSAVTPDAQTISSGWSGGKLYNLRLISNGNNLRTSSKPVISSVELDPDGTPESLTEDTAYVIVEDANSVSGWSISIIESGIVKANPTDYDIKITYGSNTPIATKKIYAGTSTATLTAYAMKITHTDANNKIRELELYSVEPSSGGFQFNFKGASEDGVEEMPLSFTAKLDTSLTDGRQLMGWTIDDGAQ